MTKMKANSDSYYPNQPPNGSGFPVEYTENPPSSYPVENHYHTYPPPAYGTTSITGTVDFKGTSYAYPYQSQNAAQQSTFESNPMEKPNSYRVAQFPQCFPGQQMSQENFPYSVMGCLPTYGRCPNVTVSNHYPEAQASFTPPLSSVPSEKLQYKYRQQLGVTPVLQFPTSQHSTLLQDRVPAGVPMSSTQKRLAEYCDPDPIPLKKQRMDQNAIPYSVQLNGYQKGLHIQGSCYLTVTEDTNHHQDSYSAVPPAKVDTLKERFLGHQKTNSDLPTGHNDIDLSVFNTKGQGCRTYNGVKEFSHLGARYIVMKVVNIFLKYMPHIQVALAKLYKYNKLMCFPGSICSKLLNLIQTQTEKLFLQGYIKHKSQICNLVNKNRCVFECQNNPSSPNQSYMLDSSVKQNYFDPNSRSSPSNIGSGATNSASLHNQSVFNSGIVSHSLPVVSAVPPCHKSFSPALSNISSPAPCHFSPVTTHCPTGTSHALPSFSSFSQYIPDPSSCDSPCTFLSESEFRDLPCGQVNKNSPVTENITSPPVFENITPPPPVSYHQETQNYDKHLNTSSANYNYQMQAAYSGFPQNHPHLLKILNQPGTTQTMSPKPILQSQVSYHQKTHNFDNLHLNPSVGSYQKQDTHSSVQNNPQGYMLGQSEKPFDAASKQIPSFPQYGMGNVNFKQHAATLMKLPETISPKPSRFLQTPDTPDAMLQQIKQNLQKANHVLSVEQPAETISPQQSGFLPKPNMSDSIKQRIKQKLQKPYNNVLPVAHPAVVQPLTQSESKSPKADYPVIPNAKRVDSSLNVPEFIELDNSGFNCFKVQPPNNESKKETQVPKAMSDIFLSYFTVKPKTNTLEVNVQPQNISQGDTMPEMSLPVNSFTEKPKTDTLEVNGQPQNISQGDTIPGMPLPVKRFTEKPKTDTLEINGQPQNISQGDTMSGMLLPVNSFTVKPKVDTLDVNVQPQNISQGDTMSGMPLPVNSFTVKPKTDTLEVNVQPQNISQGDTMSGMPLPVISFTVKPKTDTLEVNVQPQNISQGDTMSGMSLPVNSFTVKPKTDTLEVNMQPQNISQGDTMSRTPLPMTAECITIEDSDDEMDIIILDNETGKKFSLGSANPDMSVPNTVTSIPVSPSIPLSRSSDSSTLDSPSIPVSRSSDSSTLDSPSIPVSRSSDSSTLDSESSQTQTDQVFNLQTNLNKDNITRSGDVLTETGEDTMYNSGVNVGGTTFAAFTIDGDELEMTPQEFDMEMLDLLVNCQQK